MPSAQTSVPLPGSASPGRISGRGPRFSNLRGVRWRINLGILPSSSSASIDDIRRVAANARRSYANLRRRLLIDPHVPKDGNKSPDPTMDNPLSQNPESTWGRFFRSTELEKAFDQDLSRLYPEDDHYFQTHACQAMLRRILLVWCLRHPECGYRQGMHELLAPLTYVLHVDLDYLSQVRGLHEKYYNDEFDGSDCEVVSSCTPKKAKSWDFGSKVTNFDDDLDPDTGDVLLLSDPYGAEGELGIVLSEKFMEHDAYCMFDGLMSGADGVVAMNQFFYTIPSMESSTGVPPVIEASSAIYHLLSIVDSSLHAHLTELGVEPQYFALRWLRVLFGREFSLIDLLIIWDEIFLSLNDSCPVNDELEYGIMCSPRGAFILAMAVSMLLHVRSSLLATENATSCLTRLLNYPKIVNVEKLIEKARSCQILALEANMLASSLAGLMVNGALAVSRTGSQSPKSPIRIMPDRYWEEKWRVLHKEKVLQDGDSSNGGKVNGLFETLIEPCPPPSKNVIRKKEAHSVAKHSLFDDFSQNVESASDEVQSISPGQGSPSLDEDFSNSLSEFMGEEHPSAENISVITINTGPDSEVNAPELESEKSSLTSNSFIRENEDDNGNIDEECNKTYDPVSKKSETCANVESGQILDAEMKGVTEMKVRKTASGRFQWLWRIGRGSFHERNVEKGTIARTQRPSNIGNEDVGHEKYVSSASDYSWHGDSAMVEEDGDKKMRGTLKSLGQSVLENVQVIESVLQQEQGKEGDILGGNRQAAAMAALKDLRKISIILSEI